MLSLSLAVPAKAASFSGTAWIHMHARCACVAALDKDVWCLLQNWLGGRPTTFPSSRTTAWYSKPSSMASWMSSALCAPWKSRRESCTPLPGEARPKRSVRGQVFGAALRTRYSLTLSVSPGGGALVANEQAALASVYQQCAGCDAFISFVLP